MEPSDDIQHIIIAGYPKSGTTWLTRLTAELIDCPVAGFWRSDHDEIAIEGQDRLSTHKCWKSHSFLDGLSGDQQQSNVQVIYITRDPRDAAVSAANHPFQFVKAFPRLRQFLKPLPGGLRLYSLIVQTGKRVLRCRTFQAKLEVIVQTITHGSHFSVPPFARPWGEQVTAFLNSDVLVIRYEDLLSDPHGACVRILRTLDIERTEQQIESAIHNQSFAVKRESSERNRRHLRSGKSGAWADELTTAQAQRIAASAVEAMERLQYK